MVSQMTGMQTWLELSERRVEWKDRQVPDDVGQVSAIFFYKGPDSNCFSLSVDVRLQLLLQLLSTACAVCKQY